MNKMMCAGNSEAFPLASVVHDLSGAAGADSEL